MGSLVSKQTSAPPPEIQNQTTNSNDHDVDVSPSGNNPAVHNPHVSEKLQEPPGYQRGESNISLDNSLNNALAVIPSPTEQFVMVDPSVISNSIPAQKLQDGAYNRSDNSPENNTANRVDSLLQESSEINNILKDKIENQQKQEPKKQVQEVLTTQPKGFNKDLFKQANVKDINMRQGAGAHGEGAGSRKRDGSTVLDDSDEELMNAILSETENQNF